jgi:acyl-CoA thioester hydrolase
VLTTFPFVLPVDVRFRDLDAQGHVNNAVYLTYLESARIVWWQEVTGRPLAAMGMILARTEIDYRSPAAYGDRLEVGLRCASMRRSSFVLEFRVEERGSGRLVAEGRKVLVHYDYTAGRSIPIPPELRARIRERDPGVREE